MTAAEREAWLDLVCEQDEPPGKEESGDFEPLTPDELAEVREAAADELLAVEAATTGRRGPGQPGSARVFPGESCSPAAGFGPGMALDVLPGCAGLAVSADAAAGDDGFAGVSEAELAGVLCAWDRVEAHAAARKLALAAELIRRNPRPGCEPIARAVMEVAPKKAKERREAAAKDTRVERWAEDSGNAALMGCELPPDEVLAADQRITAWAKELRKAGLEGGMDELRARAFLDLLLGKDSRPRPGATSGGEIGATGSGDGPAPDDPGGPGGGGPGPAGPGGPPPSAGLSGGAVPAGFAGRVTLTVPLVTLTGLADRPGELAGLGPIDPWLARDLAAAAARNPKSTWCVTVTDQAVCRRPAAQCDVEHNTPYEAGGRTCLCNTGPKCRHDHRLKQHPGWTVDQLPDGTFRWTTPAGRAYTTEPTRYPI